MKIEKINDNQIRCTLTNEDLASRKIRISELAYGTEKAKNLFRDMMEQANSQFGFEADNIPIMVEAIPISSDGIVLIITKVEDPEELDTRFSKFAPSHEEGMADSSQAPHFSGADDILDIFQKLYEAKTKAGVKKTDSDSAASLDKEEKDTPVNMLRMYQFGNLDSVIQAARILGDYFTGVNSLYKDVPSQTYYLVLHKSEATPSEFNKVCNILSEYGIGKNYSSAAEAHLIEHSEIIISKQALLELSQL